MPVHRDGDLHDSKTAFPRYDDLSYTDFLNNHLLPNTPFLLSANATAHWPCTSWRSPPGVGPGPDAGPSKPNLEALKRYAADVVPVANTLQREFSEFSRTERSLGEVLDLWMAGQGDGLYVKDWHLFAELESRGEGAGSVYEVPGCFRDDWLNPPYQPGPRPGRFPTADEPTDTCSDFRFCYLGPAGTFTPLHRDVYASYSWSANVVGRKLWWFFPPDRLERVKDRNGDLVFDVRRLADEGGALKVLQQEGEVIFVPSGWHHQVLNLDFCISINHNFFASPTLPRVMTALQDAQARVEESIADVKEMIRDRVGVHGPWEIEWVEEVQKLLEMDAGWGWKGFWQTVLANLRCPPADEAHSPPADMRDRWVREVVARYRLLPDWGLLPEVRQIVEEVQQLVDRRATN